MNAIAFSDGDLPERSVLHLTESTDDLFRILTRRDVRELALQTDKPPCARIGADYKPVRNCKLSEDEVIETLVLADGQAEVLGLINGPRRWSFEHPLVGTIQVSAAYHGAVLQARFKLSAGPQLRASAPSVPRPTASTPGGAFGEEPPSAQFVVDMPPAPPLFEDAPSEPGSLPLSIDDGAIVAKSLEASLPIPPLDFDFAEKPQAAAEPDAPPLGLAEPSNAPALAGLLQTARERGASDLHVVAGRPVRLRIAGELVQLGQPIAAPMVDDMLRAALPERLTSTLEEHGSCDFALVDPRLGRFRTNISRQRTGLKLSARLIGSKVPTLEELGLPPSIARATEHHQGLIVITGPTGHGKTTTLAALVDIINQSRPDHVITVEDPIEYVHERKRAMISQREVGTHTRTFAAALKGSLREDPDVIVVGELRDTETVRMALSASETGHLVLATMNTPSAAKTIERLIDLFPPGDQPQVRTTLAGGLRLVVSQRLVPTCDRKQVRAAAELLPGSPQLWALIRDNKTFQIPSLQQRGKALGIVRLDESLAELIRGGATTLELAQQFAEAPDQLAALAARPEAGPSLDAPTWETPGSAQQLGKDMFAKAGKLFGGDKK